MNRVNVAIFLTAVGLIGLAPLLLVGVYLVRRRAERVTIAESTSATGRRRPGLPIVAGITAALLIIGGGVAWTFSGPGAAPPSDEARTGMSGMAGGSGSSDPDGAPVPMMLADQPLTSYVEGQDAMADVARLHGSTFEMTDAEIAGYGDGVVTIWRSGTADPETALDQVERMRERIAGGGSPFEAPHPLHARPGVYATSGMGQKHFFFASRASVWWVSVMPGMAGPVLSELLGGSA
jgi:hypothetical protein